MLAAFERTLDRFEVSDGCWPWIGAERYGRFWDGRAVISAHRFFYETFRGPIPDGLTIDHLCRTPACVRPSHLEVVTMRENVMRGESFAAKNASATHCPQGHPYVGRNVYYPPTGGRQCRECGLRADKRYRARKRKELLEGARSE